MTRRVAAVDGGGTKTLGASADVTGRVWLTPPAAGCNPQDNRLWDQNLRAALAHLPDGTDHVTLGLPGYAEVARLDAAFQAVVAAQLPGTVTLMNDVVLAYHGAFPTGGGVLVLAGTGSMAIAEGPAGLVRVGGWGDTIGDEGSANWIGRAALAAACQMLDGRRAATGFAPALMAVIGVSDHDGAFALLDWVAAMDHARSAIAGIARAVDALAEAGDATATAVLRQAADELALQATAAATRAACGPAFNWAQAGSVFRSNTVAARVADRLGRAPVPARLDALGGGLWHSARAAGWPVDDRWADRIAAALAAAFQERTTN